MKKDTLRILRDIIREELGRNMRSPPAEDVMQDWRHVDGIHADVSPAPSQGGWYVKITTEDGVGDTPMRFFGDETSAKFWARNEVMKLQNKKMGSNPKLQARKFELYSLE